MSFMRPAEAGGCMSGYPLRRARAFVL